MNNNTIRVLIIDDKKEKIIELQEAIRTKSNITKLNVELFPKRTDINGFVKKISDLTGTDNTENLYKVVKSFVDDNQIDVIILDFYLTNKTDYEINRSDGYHLLKMIRRSGGKFSHIPIYSYTFKQAELDNGKHNEASGMLQGDIPKSENIQDDLDYRILYNISFEAKRYSHAQETDIVVVCAMKTELDAIKNLPLNWESFIIANKVYHRGVLNNYKVIATSEDKMGMAEASALTTRMIDMFHPEYVVMTGIAGGTKKTEQKLLDLLIPDRVFNWQSGKYKVKKEKNQIDNKWVEKEFHIFEKDFRQEETYFNHTNIITENINEFVRNIINNVDFNGFNIQRPNILHVFNEVMVSGSAVVADKDIVNEQVDGRKIYGVDMEAYGVAFACNNHPDKPKPIIIKCITDFADEEKSDEAQSAGMHVSAVAFKVLFESIIEKEKI